MIKGSNRRGDVAELVASAYLLEKGYEIFKNTSCVGPVDIVAMSPEGDVTLIDVKRATSSLEGIIFAQKVVAMKSKGISEKLGVKFLYVFISKDFDIVVDFNEDSFYKRIEKKGFRVPTSSKFVGMTKFKVQSPQGVVSEVVGRENLMNHCGFTTNDLHKFLYKDKTLNGWRLIGKEKIRVTKEDDIR